MADYDTIIKALRKAHEAGDEAGAKRLAAMARDAQPSAPKEDKSFTGSILPFSKDAEGNVSFDSSAGLLGGLKRAFTLPHDVMVGDVDPLSDEGVSRALEMGAIASPVNPAVRAGSKIVPGVAKAMKKQEVAPPTSKALKAEAKAGYNEIRDMGVDYSSDSVANMARAAQQKLETEGFNSENAKQTFSILHKLQDPPADSIAPLSGLTTARKSFNKVPKKIDDSTDNAAAQIAREHLDKFITSPDEAAVVAGPATAAGQLLKTSNKNYAAHKRSDRLTDLQANAVLRAGASNSGKNIGNSTRQKLVTLLQNDKKRRGFNPDEVKALEGISKGSRAANISRDIGNLLGGGGGLGSLLSGGAGAAAGEMALGAPGLGAMGALAAGIGSKALSNRLTQKELALVNALTRKRSPLYEKMASEAPMMTHMPKSNEALIRALLLQQGGQ